MRSDAVPLAAVHPRLHGGAAPVRVTLRRRGGPSPSARGSPNPSEPVTTQERSIPVCTGEPGHPG